jgi:hypothetical protein
MLILSAITSFYTLKRLVYEGAFNQELQSSRDGGHFCGLLAVTLL